MNEIWCIFSECSQCNETNEADEELGASNCPDYVKFGHLRAIRFSEEEAKKATEYYDELYGDGKAKQLGFDGGFKHFYIKWDKDKEK